MGEDWAVPHRVRDAGLVLVTGAGGFVGTNIVWALRESGFAVRAMVRRPPRGPQWHGLEGVEFVHGDVRDARGLEEVMEDVAFVVHAAALTDLIPRPRREAFRVNVEGTRNVCTAALKAGVRRLVHLSSAATVARGTADQPANEDTPYNLGDVRAPYYASKRQAERVVQEFGRRGLETITLCPTYVIGPRDVRPTTNELILFLASNVFPVTGPGGMNVIDVRETAAAHVRALWLGEPGTRYLLAGPYCSYVELGTIAQRIAGTHRPVQVLPSWAKPVGSFFLAFACGLLPQPPRGLSIPSFQYGFIPFHVSGARGDQAFGLRHRPIAESVADTLRWFQHTGLAPWLRAPLPRS